MKTHSETIEIKAPPVETLHKKRPSCIRRGCATSFGCLFLVLIGGVIFLHSIANPDTVKTGLPPKNTTSIVPVYDAEAIETVSLTKRSTTFHRITKYPLFNDIAEFTRTKSPFNRVSLVPEEADMDSLAIEWTKLSAPPSFIFRYYQDELKKAGFSVQVTENTDTLKEVLFSKASPPLEGVIIISDPSKASGTDTMTLTIHGDLSSL